MYYDIEAAQQWSMDHRVQLARSFADGQADTARVRIVMGQLMSWLGKWFDSWGHQLRTTEQHKAYVRTDV